MALPIDMEVSNPWGYPQFSSILVGFSMKITMQPLGDPILGNLHIPIITNYYSCYISPYSPIYHNDTPIDIPIGRFRAQLQLFGLGFHGDAGAPMAP